MKSQHFFKLFLSSLVLFLSSCGSTSFVTTNQINLLSRGTTINCKKYYDFPCYEIRLPELGIFRNSPLVENVEYIDDKVHIRGTILYQSTPRSNVEIYILNKNKKIFVFNNNEYLLGDKVGQSNSFGEFNFAAKIGETVIFIDQDHCVPNVVFDVVN